MKRAGSLIPQAMSTAPNQVQAPRELDDATVSVVNQLFSELQSIFPAWRQAWPTAEAIANAKRTWIKAFMDSGLNSLEQIRYGIQQCRASGGDFAPSVGKFIKWCNPSPEHLGMPSVEKAYLEAARKAHPAFTGGWSHQAVYHAATMTGFYELTNLSEERSRKLFERNYEATVRMIVSGQPLRQIPKALPESVSIRTPEIGKAALNELRATLARSHQ
ncbi:replication protein P [Pseudomonas aeruginosa]|nr:replication protein P [Pseudomonas aeruginosa]KSO41662.1 Replication protein P [Pseudomonas aeruginosa]MBG7134430.1 Replication protein P [Pseudomonas aeruginosa]MDP5479154.1 replication protein P [Pseudomonas aeruginosa]MDP5521226.1 replication protein P [Pseudomonas aeruginosa]HEJ4237562.1 Replication protein P [Pseudomonas aeruginosa]